jgi:hypothetical protein
MARLGTLTLQSLDETDIFLKEDVYMDGVTDPGELPCDITGSDPGFESGEAWLTGKVPEPIPVFVDGDSTTIVGWFKGDGIFPTFYLKVYLEYEEVEEMINEEEKESEETNDGEIHTELCS